MPMPVLVKRLSTLRVRPRVREILWRRAAATADAIARTIEAMQHYRPDDPQLLGLQRRSKMRVRQLAVILRVIDALHRIAGEPLLRPLVAVEVTRANDAYLVKTVRR